VADPTVQTALEEFTDAHHQLGRPRVALAARSRPTSPTGLV